MPKRFHTLKRALKLLRPLAGGDAVDLPDTTALGFFQAVQSGKKHVSYGDRPTASKPGTILEAAVLPFATPASGALFAQVTLSERSSTSDNLTKASISKAVLGYETDNTAFNTRVSLKGFRSAKATIRVFATGTTKPTSKLTGQAYKKANVTSYSYPFGLLKDARGEGYNARKVAIVNAVTQKDTNSVSFTPEQF